MRATLNLLGIFCLMLWSVTLFANDKDWSALEKQALAEKNPQLLIELANHYLAKENLTTAKKHAEKALLHGKEVGNLTATVKANEILGIIAKNRFDYTNATQFLLLALDGWKSAKDQNGIAAVNYHIGQIFHFQKDYVNASVHLDRAKTAFTELNKKEDLALVHQAFGDVYLAQQFIGKAKQSYTQAFDLYIAEEAYAKAAKIARFLGNTSLELGDYEGALVYFAQSLDLNGSMEDLPNIAKDYNDLALTHLAQKNLEEAMDNNTIAYDLRTELGDTLGKVESLKNFGLIYTQLGQKQKAIPFLLKAGKLLDALPVQANVPEYYEEIAATFTQLGEFKEALKFQKAFSKSQKNLFDKDKATAMLELTTRYQSESEAEEYRQQITLLEKDQQANFRIRGFLLAVIALIAGLLASLFFSYQRKKKDNQVLQDKNEEILWQTSEIDRKNIQLEEKAASLDLLNNKLVDEMAERESIERSSFARDSFLAMMSHQMRTPINIIVGLSHLLLEDNPREDQKESLRNLQFSANNLVVFINDVLDYSKIEAGKLVMQTREFKLPQVVEDVHKWSQIPAEEKDVALTFSMDSKIPEILSGDPIRLNQILTNLISNSLSYTCLLYTSPSPRDRTRSRMPSSA